MRWAATRGLFYSKETAGYVITFMQHSLNECMKVAPYFTAGSLMRQVPNGLKQQNSPGRYTYTQAMRVKKHEQFQKIHDEGDCVVDAYGVFYIMPSPNGVCQLGTAVGKKLGHAVLRNKIKRRMRETFRLHQERLTRPVSIVWVARGRLARAPFAMYEKVFMRLAAKAGLLK
jgi:ribonuclease P protein component